MTVVTNLEGCELGPIRPPSEANSLLLRVTRNCPWNKCAFCPVYKRTKFSRRSEDELIAEIDLLAEAAEHVRQRAGVDAGSDDITGRDVLTVINDPAASDEERRVALWLSRGARRVFLQDADSLVIPPKRVVPVLEHLRARFPTVDRVTTYARSRTLAKRTPEQLAELRAAGLTRIHVGVESGSDAVLELVTKGCRAEHHLRGCSAVREAGFELTCYVMPGLGGRALSEEHARETARVLKEIDPHHVRLRTLFLDCGVPLHEAQREGRFEICEEDEIVVEIQAMLRGLIGATGRVISDHDRNLLMEIEGQLTDDAERLDGICAHFLDLPRDQQDAFVVARRSGYFRSLEGFLSDRRAVETFTQVAGKLRERGNGSLVRGMELELGPRSI
ncbi:MAG: radical SAM protein [Deltaproteobacteria bacterium]|nr:radical SAM protein [Deltaproteobacteria bacterium]